MIKRKYLNPSLGSTIIRNLNNSILESGGPHTDLFGELATTTVEYYGIGIKNI